MKKGLLIFMAIAGMVILLGGLLTYGLGIHKIVLKGNGNWGKDERKMSHSKLTKRGYSLYIEKWNCPAKKYINTCILCDRQGYSPVIEDKDFCSTLENKVIYTELTKTLREMPLDEFGRCEVCGKVQDRE